MLLSSGALVSCGIEIDLTVEHLQTHAHGQWKHSYEKKIEAKNIPMCIPEPVRARKGAMIIVRVEKQWQFFVEMRAHRERGRGRNATILFRKLRVWRMNSKCLKLVTPVA